MIDKKNWRLAKQYLDYRLRVDQITKGSLNKEQTHLRYLLQWANDRSFRDAPKAREAVSLDEILAIASQSANTIFERRARVAAVFLFLSGT